MINKKTILIFSVVTFLVLLLLGIFMPTSILQEPNITPAEYLADIPYLNVSIFNLDFILIVPSSTVFILILGIQTIVLGFTFLKDRRSEKNTWWGISMLFWGLGALFAGMSYQGLGYELKCALYDICIFTSWFELCYLYFT
ncbi:MAG: hypothetical protein KAH13_03940, partial [Tenericutes bacterium]|nr:hypothetical protein [Mycoplasmatota bacterium]